MIFENYKKKYFMIIQRLLLHESQYRELGQTSQVQCWFWSTTTIFDCSNCKLSFLYLWITKKEIMNSFFLKPFKKLSRGRRLNIKRVIFFPLIVYSTYLLLDSFMPLFMVGFVIWLVYNWTGKRRLWWWSASYCLSWLLGFTQIEI